MGARGQGREGPLGWIREGLDALADVWESGQRYPAWREIWGSIYRTAGFLAKYNPTGAGNDAYRAPRPRDLERVWPVAGQLGCGEDWQPAPRALEPGTAVERLADGIGKRL